MRNMDLFTCIKVTNICNTFKPSLVIVSLLNCEYLGSKNICQGLVLNIFLKAYQYATTDERVCKCLRYDHVKGTHENLHKCITQLNKSNKGQKKKWNKMSFNYGSPKKTLMKIR